MCVSSGRTNTERGGGGGRDRGERVEVVFFLSRW